MVNDDYNMHGHSVITPNFLVVIFNPVLIIVEQLKKKKGKLL